MVQMKKFANVALIVAMVFAPAQVQANMDGQLDRVVHTAEFEATAMYDVMPTSVAIGSVPGN